MEKSNLIQYLDERVYHAMHDIMFRIDTKRHLRPPVLSLPELIACEPELIPVGTDVTYNHYGPAECSFHKTGQSKWEFRTPAGLRVSAIGGFREIYERFILFENQKN